MSGQPPDQGLPGYHHGERRREEPRATLREPLKARCSTWASFGQLFAQNVSRSGIFVATARPSQNNESVDIDLYLPDGTAIRLGGVVRHVFHDQGQQQGVGVQLTHVAEDDLQRYHALVEHALRNQTPNADPASAPPPRDPTSPAPPAAPRQTLVQAPPPQPPMQAPPAQPPPPQPPPPPPSAAPSTSAGSGPPPVAIDFGTSRSSVSLVVEGTAMVLPLPNGGWEIPSVVGFLNNGHVVVGDEARQMLSSDPTNVIASPKRLLGRSFDDVEIQSFLAGLAMPATRGSDGSALLHTRGRSYTVPQVCAPVIYYLRQVAEQYLGHAIRDVTLTTPVSFSAPRYEALRNAAALAGLRVVDIVDEPTAAALTHRGQSAFQGLVAVYDFGGGTFDFSVVDVTAGDFKVVATAGDSWLGGDDFDEALANAAANAFWRQHGLELRNDAVQWQRLMAAAETAKQQLSTNPQVTLAVNNVALTRAGPLSLCFSVNQEQFASLTTEITQRSIDTCMQALELSGLSPTDLRATYLSGGTTYIPPVRAAVARFLGKPAEARVPPERAVVLGAAIFASMRSQSRLRR